MSEYTYTLVYVHDTYPNVKITIDAESSDSPEYLRAHPLALDLTQLVDVFAEDAELSMYDYTLVEIRCGLESIIRYDDNSVDVSNTPENEEDTDNR